jgi:hypothetical protein
LGASLCRIDGERTLEHAVGEFGIVALDGLDLLEGLPRDADCGGSALGRTVALDRLWGNVLHERAPCWDGTSVNLDPGLELDALRVTIDASDVSDGMGGASRAALAEVEVIAKATGASAPRVTFAPGNANCDAVVDLADAVTILNSLFLTSEDLCCAPAADANGDDLLGISDPIVLLAWLFRSAEPLLPDFGSCGRREEGLFVCEIQSCPD